MWWSPAPTDVCGAAQAARLLSDFEVHPSGMTSYINVLVARIAELERSQLAWVNKCLALQAGLCSANDSIYCRCDVCVHGVEVEP